MLLAFGVANCAGTVAAGAVLGRWFRLTLPLVLLAFAGAALLFFFGAGLALNLFLVLIWGLLFGFVPVGWSAWIADQAELAGGLSVAVTQFAIGLVAAVGGLTFDAFGIRGIFLIAAAFLVVAALWVRISFTLYARETGRLP